MNFNAFFHSTKFRVLVCILALLTGIMLYSLKSGAETDLATRTLQALTAPARKVSASISDSINRKLDTYYEAKAYREENQRLREQIASLNQELIGYDDAVEERDALRDQLGIKEQHSTFTLSTPCKVIMPVVNDATYSFQIDQGTEEGILLNAPVICADGLIGVVTEVGPHYSSVTTILSPELSVGAVILQTGDGGIVEGNLRNAAERCTRMMYLDKKSGVSLGNLVMTAGTTGLFPYGIPIGNITELGLEESGLSLYAVVSTSVDFSALESVTVLLDFDGKDASLNETK
ncbi:MAG: rod shape-determining protein MreC [Oscillospiraceae bacterium]|nr:rod shape-determining protein MreC [Oscillospiraceae bacterium]